MTSTPRCFFALAVIAFGTLSSVGCANRFTGGSSLFEGPPGTNGPRSDDEIAAQAAKDSWQPGSSFTVNTAPAGSVR
ncbi:MAG: hypothetical protein MPJ50_05445 [Pirellulales bacterium]|nr:hypothetical protein [Pirellulales bacterium]